MHAASPYVDDPQVVNRGARERKLALSDAMGRKVEMRALPRHKRATILREGKGGGSASAHSGQ